MVVDIHSEAANLLICNSCNKALLLKTSCYVQGWVCIINIAITHFFSLKSTDYWVWDCNFLY